MQLVGGERFEVIPSPRAPPFGSPCAGEAMQRRAAIKRAVALALSNHRRPKMLARRQAHAREIFAGAAQGYPPLLG